MVDTLRSNGIAPSTRLYNHLIQAYLDTLRFQRRVLRDPERHLPQGVKAVEDLRLREPVEYFQAMHSVLHQMSTGGSDPPNEALVVKPDWITYLHLVMAHRLAMQGEQEDDQQVTAGDNSEHLASLLALYEDMLQSIRHPPIVLLDAFLQSIARMEGKPDVAWQLYGSILRKGEINAEGGRNPQPVEWPGVRPSARTFEILIELNARHLQVDACLNTYALLIQLVREQVKNQASAEGRRLLESERREREKLYDAETLKFMEADQKVDASAPVFYEPPRPTGLMYRQIMQMILSSESGGGPSTYLPMIQALFLDMLNLNIPVSLAHFTLVLRAHIRMAQLQKKGVAVEAQTGIQEQQLDASVISNTPTDSAAAISNTISHLLTQYPELRQIALQAPSSSPDARFRTLALNAFVEWGETERFREAYELLRPLRSSSASRSPPSQTPTPASAATGALWQTWTWEEHLEWLEKAKTKEMVLAILDVLTMKHDGQNDAAAAGSGANHAASSSGLPALRNRLLLTSTHWRAILSTLFSRDRVYRAFRSWVDSVPFEQRKDAQEGWSEWKSHREQEWLQAERYSSSNVGPYPTGYPSYISLFLSLHDSQVLSSRTHDAVVKDLNFRWGRPPGDNQLVVQEMKEIRIGGRKVRRISSEERREARKMAKEAHLKILTSKAKRKSLPPGPVADWHQAQPRTDLAPLDTNLLFASPSSSTVNSGRKNRYPTSGEKTYLSAWTDKVRACESLPELDRVWNDVLAQLEISQEAQNTKAALLMQRTKGEQQTAESSVENVRQFVLPSSLSATLLAREVLHYDTPHYKGSPAFLALCARLPDRQQREQVLAVQRTVLTHAIYLTRGREKEEVKEQREKNAPGYAELQLEENGIAVAVPQQQSPKSPSPLVAAPLSSHSDLRGFLRRQLPLVLAFTSSRNLVLLFEYFTSVHDIQASTILLQHILYSQILVYQKYAKTGFVLPDKKSDYYTWTSATQYTVNPEKAIYIPSTFHGFTSDQMQAWYRMLRRAMAEAKDREEAITLWKISLMYERFLFNLFPRAITTTYRLPTIPEIEYQAWCMYEQGHLDSAPFRTWYMYADLLSRYSGLLSHDPHNPVLQKWIDQGADQQREVVRGLNGRELEGTIARMLEWVSTYEERETTTTMGKADGAATENLMQVEEDESGRGSQEATSFQSSSSETAITISARTLLNLTPTPGLAFLSTFFSFLDISPDGLHQPTSKETRHKYFDLVKHKLLLVPSSAAVAAAGKDRLMLDTSVFVPTSVCLAVLHWCLSQRQLWQHRALSLYPAHSVECEVASEMAERFKNILGVLLDPDSVCVQSPETHMEMMLYEINWRVRRPYVAGEVQSEGQEGNDDAASSIFAFLRRVFRKKIVPLADVCVTDAYVQYRLASALGVMMVKLSNLLEINVSRRIVSSRLNAVGFNPAFAVDQNPTDLLTSVVSWTTQHITDGQAIGLLIRELHATYAEEGSEPLSPIVTEGIFAMLPHMETSTKQASLTSSSLDSYILHSPRDFPLSTFSSLFSLLRASSPMATRTSLLKKLDRLSVIMEQQKARLTKTPTGKKQLPVLKAQVAMMQEKILAGGIAQKSPEVGAGSIQNSSASSTPAPPSPSQVESQMGVFAALLKKVQQQNRTP